MDNPFSNIISSLNNNNKKSKKNSKFNTEENVIFPNRLKGNGGCKYERINDLVSDNNNNNKEVIYVPLGASHVKRELGWRAKYDNNKKKLYFIKMNDATEKTWRLPMISEDILRQYGVINSSEKKKKKNKQNKIKEKSKVEDNIRELSVLKSDSDDNDEDEEEEEEEKEEKYQNKKVDINETNLNIIENNNVITEEIEPQRDGAEIYNIYNSSYLSPNLSSMQNFNITSTENKSVWNSKELEENVLISNVNPYLTSIDDDTLSDENETNMDVVKDILENEIISRSLLENEEEEGRNELLDVIQIKFDELLFRELSAERQNNNNNNNPFNENINDDNDQFLYNVRLNNFLEEEEAVTPLEKLLHETSPDNKPVKNQQNSYNPYHQLIESSNSSTTGIYENIYRPFSISYNNNNNNNYSPPTIKKNKEKTKKEELLNYNFPVERLLESQRHQVELERRLTQRGRDNLERTLEEKYQQISLPSNIYSQLQYKPSSDFTREREAILGSVGISDYHSPRDEKNLILKNMKEEEEKEKPKVEKERELLEGKAQSAGVSPISSRSFINSPSPGKPSESEYIRRESIITEMYETKYEKGMAAMQELLELYQKFLITKPLKKSVTFPSNFESNEIGMSEPTELSTTKYEERLARIKILYNSNKVKKNDEVHKYYRLIHTPPLPPSLDNPDIILNKSVPKLFQTTTTNNNNNPINYHSYSSNLEYPKNEAYIKRQGIKTPPFPNNNNNLIPSNIRQISTPEITLPMKDLNNNITITKPILSWDTKRSGNILISQKGTTCIADTSRALQLIASEKEKLGVNFTKVSIPMYAIGTIGISEGEFIFEIRIDTPPSSTATATTTTQEQNRVFAIGVATKYYRGSHKRSPAYLFRSDGTIIANADDITGVPYGIPYYTGSHITVHLNLMQQELNFFLNGRPLGVAFKFHGVEDPEPLFPLVVLSGAGDTASFVPPSIPQLPKYINISSTIN